MTFNIYTLLLLATFAVKQSISGYVLRDTYAGDSFFDGFDFYTGVDPSSGYVQYLDQGTASNGGLVGSIDNMTFIGVDNQKVTTSGRESVRLISKKSYNHGLFIADISHMPGGVCGTWPALWAVGPNWPQNGGFIEGVNDDMNNQMTLHTDSGCSITNTGFSGMLLTLNCDKNAPDQDMNAGCGISNPNPGSYGTGFNEAFGGVYVMEWTSDSIKVFFFDRFHIPSDIGNGQPDPESWGIPSAQFSGGCDIDDHFNDLQLVIDTTFCGQWGGSVWGSSECATKASTCIDFVANNPSAFTEAYWEFLSIKVYHTD